MSFKELAPNYHMRLKRVIELAGSGERVLDVGCGDGFLALQLKKNFKEVYGVDVNEIDLAIARRINPKKQVHFIKASATNLPFLYDPLNYVLMRLLNKHLPIGVWGFGHVKLYSNKDIINLLDGFKVKKIIKDPHVLTAFIENYYFVNLLQPSLKSDPKNKERTLKNIRTLEKRIL